MINRFLILLVIFSNLNLDIKAVNIPKPLIDFINKEYSDYKILTTQDYIQGWDGFISDSNLPFYCTSDFNGDKMPDHALLLIDSKKQLHLLVFLDSNGSFKSIPVDEFESQLGGIQTIISIEKKGVWESISETKKVANDGITVEMIEESLSWSYYFDGQNFKKFLYD